MAVCQGNFKIKDLSSGVKELQFSWALHEARKQNFFLKSLFKVNSLGSLLLVGQIDSSTVPEEYGMQDIYLDYRKKQASAVKKGKARSEFRSWSVQGHKGTLLTRGGAGSWIVWALIVGSLLGLCGVRFLLQGRHKC